MQHSGIYEKKIKQKQIPHNAMTLSLLVDANIGAYQAFTRDCRHKIDELVKTGKYPCLALNSHRGHEDLIGAGFRTRVSVLAKPPYLPQTGQRNLNIGHTQVVLVVVASLNDEKDYTKGFSSKTRLRMVLGPGLAYDTLNERLMRSYKGAKPVLKTDLFKGDYEGFLNVFCQGVNTSIADFKRAHTSHSPT